MKNCLGPRPGTAARNVWWMLGAVLLVLGPSGCATSPPPQPEPSSEQPATRSAFVVYPNGMRLVAHEIPSATQVSLTVSYLAGALDEPAGKEGLAYLTAQLTATARHQEASALSLHQQLKAAGAQLTATVTHDTSDFILTLPPERLARVVSLEAQRMKDPLGPLTETAFLQQRSHIAESLRQQDVSENLLEWELYTQLLPGHPYGRLPMGTPESIERLTLEEVRAFAKQHYTPAHAVVVMTGPVSLADAKFEVARAFPGLAGNGPVPPVQRSTPSFPQALADGTPLARMEGPVQHPRLYLAWTLPGFSSGKVLHPEATQGLLEGLLKQEFKEDPRVVQSEVKCHVADGVMLLIAWVEVRDAGMVQAVEKQLLGKLDTLSDPHFLQLLRRGVDILGRQIIQRMVTQFPTEQMAMYLRATGRADYLNALQQQLRTLIDSEDELPGYLRGYLVASRVRRVLVSPRPPDWHEALARAREHSRRAESLLATKVNETDTARLEQATAAYRSALEALPRQQAPLQWAETQNNLGNILVALGSREPGTAHFEEAAAAFRAALEEWKRERVPQDWARAQSNLGTTLSELGMRNADPARLEQAVTALRSVLEVKGLEQPPLWWASLHNNLGNDLLQLGTRKRDAAMLCEAHAHQTLALSKARGQEPALASAIEQNLEGGTKLLRLRFGERALQDCLKKTAPLP